MEERLDALAFFVEAVDLVAAIEILHLVHLPAFAGELALQFHLRPHFRFGQRLAAHLGMVDELGGSQAHVERSQADADTTY